MLWFLLLFQFLCPQLAHNVSLFVRVCGRSISRHGSFGVWKKILFQEHFCDIQTYVHVHFRLEIHTGAVTPRCDVRSWMASQQNTCFMHDMTCAKLKVPLGHPSLVAVFQVENLPQTTSHLAEAF